MSSKSAETEQSIDAIMGLALEQARLALQIDEVPVGAVVVKPENRVLEDGYKVIGAGHNLRESTRDATAHAEVVALRQANQAAGAWNLTGCFLVVTLEPCLMCAGAAINSRIDTIIYGADDPKGGACHSLYSVCDDQRLNHNIKVVRGVKSEESAALLKDFFADLRQRRPTPES